MRWTELGSTAVGPRAGGRVKLAVGEEGRDGADEGERVLDAGSRGLAGMLWSGSVGETGPALGDASASPPTPSSTVGSPVPRVRSPPPPLATEDERSGAGGKGALGSDASGSDTGPRGPVRVEDAAACIEGGTPGTAGCPSSVTHTSTGVARMRTRASMSTSPETGASVCVGRTTAVTPGTRVRG